MLRRAGVEGTGAYGAGLTRVLHAAGVTVVEVNRPDRATRRRRGKTDAVDAEAAARAVLGGSATAAAKTANGPVEGIRVLKLAKDSAVKARVQAMNQLHAVLVNADPALRERLAPLTPARLLRACAQLDPSCWAGVDATVAYTLARLARRVRSLDAEVREPTGASAPRSARSPRSCLSYGASALTVPRRCWSPPGTTPPAGQRSSFAALCGVSPVEASSGKVQRHRLNRGGHRQANAALFRAVLTGLRWDPRTQAYLQRRRTEGLSTREAIRCPKRYLARTVYKIIVEAIQPAAQAVPA